MNGGKKILPGRFRAPESKSKSQRKKQGDFSKVTLEANKQWSSAFKVLRENYHKYLFLYPSNQL